MFMYPAFVISLAMHAAITSVPSRQRIVSISVAILYSRASSSATLRASDRQNFWVVTSM